MSAPDPLAPGALTRRQALGPAALAAVAVLAWLVFAAWPEWLAAGLIARKAFVSAVLAGLTLAGLSFLVASGFTLVVGLMRIVNLAHGSLCLLGAYIGYEVASRTGPWLLADPEADNALFAVSSVRPGPRRLVARGRADIDDPPLADAAVAAFASIAPPRRRTA